MTRAAHGPADRGPQHLVLHLLPQVGEDRAGALQYVLLPPGERDELPDDQHQRDGQQLRPDRRPGLAGQPARHRPACCSGGSSRLSSPRSAWSATMPAHFLTQPVGEPGRDFRDLRGVDPALAVPRQGVLVDDRPGRLLSRMTRSPSRAASRTLWVTNSTVSVRSAQIRSSSSCSRSLVIASSAPNGSSISSTSASCASALAIATRCRMPPDSSCGRLSRNAAEPHSLQ